MTVGIPHPSTSGQSWQLGDYARIIRTGKTSSAGAGQVTFDPVDAGRRWEIARAVVSCAGAITPQPTCRLYTVPAGQDPQQQYECSGTLAGLFDEADYPDEGLWVLEGEQLLAVWAGAPASQPIAVNLQVRLMVR